MQPARRWLWDFAKPWTENDAPGLGTQSKAPGLGRRLLVTLIIVFFYFLPSLSQAILGIFACYDIDHGATNPYYANNQATWHSGYWVNDVDQPCFDGWHLSIALAVGIPCIVCICLGIPLLAAALLWWAQRAWSAEDEVKQTLGFMYHRYRQEGVCMYWETVVQLLMLALVAATVFSRQLGPLLQIVIVLGVLGCMLTATLYFRPFEAEPLQTASLVALASVTLLMYCTFFLLSNLGPLVHTANEATRDGFGVLMLVVVVGTLLYLVWVVMSTNPVVWATQKLTTLQRYWPRLLALVRQSKPLSKGQGRHEEALNADPVVASETYILG